jgi:hypothetical protein
MPLKKGTQTSVRRCDHDSKSRVSNKRPFFEADTHIRFSCQRQPLFKRLFMQQYCFFAVDLLQKSSYLCCKQLFVWPPYLSRRLRAPRPLHPGDALLNQPGQQRPRTNPNEPLASPSSNRPKRACQLSKWIS